ncbi:hypothetical protein [Lacticigenium naphthae]|uniref:hypothetical protein n=1 Tax=Lacticigenium naphthae TaxID=515351 RepID=UPI0003FF0521|nr:hypothetical protein [Lacticigenium naphthae]
MNEDKGSILISVLLLLFVVIQLVLAGTYNYKNQQVTQNMIIESYTLKTMINLSRVEINKGDSSDDWKDIIFTFEEGEVEVFKDGKRNIFCYTAVLDSGETYQFNEGIGLNQ